MNCVKVHVFNIVSDDRIACRTRLGVNSGRKTINRVLISRFVGLPKSCALLILDNRESGPIAAPLILLTQSRHIAWCLLVMRF